MAERHWVWQFEQPPEAVWRVLADTARFNEVSGFPRHRVEEIPEPDGSVTYLAHARVGPFAVRWRDLPVQSVYGRNMVHCREFLNGPLASLCATLELAPEDGGTRARYLMEAVPRGLLGRLIMPFFLAASSRVFERFAAEAKAFLDGDRPQVFELPPRELDRAVLARLERTVTAIEQTPEGHGLARRLAEHLRTGLDLDLQHIRPLRLAKAWGVDPRQVVELCLRATREGLLAMDWVLLCPRCRGAKAGSSSLDRLPTGAHCATCNIDYGRAFYRNVELTFRPAAWLRPVESGEFCLFAPMTTPHVKVQQTLDPGERRTVSLALPHGAYRLRTLHPGGQSDILWSGDGFPAVIADGRETLPGPAGAADGIELRNASARRQTLVVEEQAWLADALTAHRATTLQTFRELFAGEALRPGDEASIERIAIMFTDLKSSTALYTRIGDAAAYTLVRDHFAYLAEQVRANDGAVVKTIGDAVMAVFAEPADAVRAAIDVQRNLDGFNRARRAAGRGEPVVIKLGLHEGSCVTVRLNDRLDYFGTTVNMAARLQAQSTGGDIVLSPELADDPAVRPLLEPFAVARESAELKGFERPVPFLRLTPEALAGAAAE